MKIVVIAKEIGVCTCKQGHNLPIRKWIKLLSSYPSNIGLLYNNVLLDIVQENPIQIYPLSSIKKLFSFIIASKDRSRQVI
jgi:hypothetical protein